MTPDQKGMTLTELMVAMILIGIVMMGIASFTVAIKQVQDVTNKSTVLAMQTAASMSHIAKNAQVAIGWKDDPGIIVNPSPGGGIAPHIAFRQDNNSPATPDNYNDDTWYIYYMTSLLSNSMFFCKQPNAAPFLPLAYVPRHSVSGPCGWDQNFATHAEILQTNIKPNPNFPAVALVNDPVNLDFYFFMNIRAIYDPTKPAHPIDNPEYTLTTQISPLSHSWN